MPGTERDATRREFPDAPFEWARPLHYSQVVRAGDLVFTAGQAGYGEDGELVEGTEGQLRRALLNVEAALAAAGSSLGSIIKLTVYLQDPADFAVWQAVRADMLSAPWPASTAVGAALLLDGMRCEIDAIAVAERAS